MRTEEHLCQVHVSYGPTLVRCCSSCRSRQFNNYKISISNFKLLVRFQNSRHKKEDVKEDRRTYVRAEEGGLEDGRRRGRGQKNICKGRRRWREEGQKKRAKKRT
ncbi:hypothetical protein M6B38_260075 [Iris pallida]|uniref:Uncharacterized protein n=1 Tax=Iris pallida TaxID=29817 RepID=A0AAX6IE92_IRIPA|nr:hypothetical protein M6B38_260075 [Iris pallida]